MKIILNPTEKNELNKILNYRDQNLEAGDFYSLVLNEFYDLIEESDFLTDKKESEYFSLLMNKSSISINTNELLKLINNNKVNIFHQLDDKRIINNPYYKSIRFNNIKEKKFSLDTNYFSKYECFLFDEVDLDNYSEINHIGFFNKEVNYFSLNENNTTWMSITPYEINTMEKDIINASGRVLTLGLGLGYFQYMINKKSNIKSITIVENSRDVINLFNKYIAPYFDNLDKIHIINDDAFNYLKQCKEKYDYVYFDIHHNEEEGLLYLLSLISNKIRIKNLHFWIEKSILILARRYLLSIIEEYFHGYKNSNYLNPTTNEEQIISHLYNVYKDVEIKSINELKSLIDINNIKQKLITT